MHVKPMLNYWQESDLSAFDPDYAATLAERFNIDFTPTATADVTGETASAPDRSELPSATSPAGSSSIDAAADSESGLNTGSKAGIGVGAAIGAILLCVAGFLLYKRRTQKKAKLDRKSAIQNEQPEFVQTQAV
jgi:LPXTG-motif cell wall-anchored protein